MDKETDIRINVLDEVKAMIKNQILDLEHSSNRDNYMQVKERKMGMQMVLCAVADMQYEIRKGAKQNEVLGTIKEDK